VVASDQPCLYCRTVTAYRHSTRIKFIRLSSLSVFTPVTNEKTKGNWDVNCNGCNRKYSKLDLSLDWISQYAALTQPSIISFRGIFGQTSNPESLFLPKVLIAVTEPKSDDNYYYDKETYHVIFKLFDTYGYLDCRKFSAGIIKRRKTFIVVDVVRLN